MRAGMYKNLRVGRIKHVGSAKGTMRWVLIEALEYCTGYNGLPYDKHPTYNLWIMFDTTKFGIDTSRLHQWGLFGFYIQSFRNKEAVDDYTTALTMRSFEWINDEQSALELSEKVSKSILNFK